MRSVPPAVLGRISIPEDLLDLLRVVSRDFPAILHGNLVGIYLWGSLTYDAFDERCSDVDCVGVTRRDLDECEFSRVDQWFRDQEQQNPWTRRLEMRFVIDGEFLDKSSQCCGHYLFGEKLVRHGSDGNPIIWLNVARSGVTLWGKDAKSIAPEVSDSCLNDALRLELGYLQEGLTSRVDDRSDQAFIHNAYAVLTACRILYTARHRALASKDAAYTWAMATVPAAWRPIIHAAKLNRLKNGGSTTPQLEQDAKRFIGSVADELNHMPDR